MPTHGPSDRQRQVNLIAKSIISDVFAIYVAAKMLSEATSGMESLIWIQLKIVARRTRSQLRRATHLSAEHCPVAAQAISDVEVFAIGLSRYWNLTVKRAPLTLQANLFTAMALLIERLDNVDGALLSVNSDSNVEYRFRKITRLLRESFRVLDHVKTDGENIHGLTVTYHRFSTMPLRYGATVLAKRGCTTLL